MKPSSCSETDLIDLLLDSHLKTLVLHLISSFSAGLVVSLGLVNLNASGSYPPLSSSKGISGKVFAGISSGAVDGLLLVAGVLYFGFKRKRLSTSKVQPAQSRHAQKRKAPCTTLSRLLVGVYHCCFWNSNGSAPSC